MTDATHEERTLVWAKSDLLDRLLISSDGVDIGVVDDLELSDDEQPCVTALLNGTDAIRPRIDGRLGAWWDSAGRRIGSVTAPTVVRIPVEEIQELGRSGIRLRLDADLAPTTNFRDWVHDTIIGRIPGNH